MLPNYIYCEVVCDTFQNIYVDMSVEGLSKGPNLNKSSFIMRSLTVTDLTRQQTDADRHD